MYLTVSSPKLTDERTWDLKVGFDVDQLRLAAADPVFFSLEKKVEKLIVVTTIIQDTRVCVL